MERDSNDMGRAGGLDLYDNLIYCSKPGLPGNHVL